MAGAVKSVQEHYADKMKLTKYITSRYYTDTMKMTMSYGRRYERLKLCDNCGIIIPQEGDTPMPQILPIKELKDTSAISELCHKTDEPIFITKNGYGDMVLMSIELYESIQKRWSMYRDIERSEQQIEKGKVKDAGKALSAIRDKYGL